MSATITVTTTQQARISPKVERKLLTELRGYGSIATEMKALEGAKRGHSGAVLQLALEGVDGDRFELEGYKVAVVKGAKNRKLSTDKLIKRLVKDGKYSVKAAQAVLEDCTEDVPKKDHVRISVPGEGEDK